MVELEEEIKPVEEPGLDGPQHLELVLLLQWLVVWGIVYSEWDIYVQKILIFNIWSTIWGQNVSSMQDCLKTKMLKS